MKTAIYLCTLPFSVYNTAFLYYSSTIMDREYLIAITNEAYHLTLLFPKKEPLRYKVREVANEVLADLLTMFKEKPTNVLVSKVETNCILMDSFLEVAKKQEWVERSLVNIVQEGYKVIQEEVVKLKPKINTEEKKVENTDKKEKPLVSLNSRQKKILDVLKQKDSAQVKDIQEIFPDITKRTLRRDFEALLASQLVERVGERSETFYRLADRTL